MQLRKYYFQANYDISCPTNLACLQLYCHVALDGYLIGVGRADCTGPVAELPFVSTEMQNPFPCNTLS